MSMTPTSHGAWRVIDGRLVDEAAKPAVKPKAPAPSPESAPALEGGASPISPRPRRKAHPKPE